MDGRRPTRRRISLFEPAGRLYARLLPGRLCTVLLLAALAVSVAAGPQTSNFVHAVGFSFDYPIKWQLKRVQEGMMLIPHKAVRDSAGRPMELMFIGFVDTAGVTDPFEPSFADAFERRYRSIVPSLARSGDLDWLDSPLGTALLVSYLDGRGNQHQLYCAVHGDLGIFLAHAVQDGAQRLRPAMAGQIFSSFGWTDSVIDPALVRSWTQAASPAATAEPAADRWTFATDGRLRRTTGPEHGGFYSSINGVLNIVWDHGVEESYLYTVASGVDGGPRLELRHPDGAALRLQ